MEAHELGNANQTSRVHNDRHGIDRKRLVGAPGRSRLGSLSPPRPKKQDDWDVSRTGLCRFVQAQRSSCRPGRVAISQSDLQTDIRIRKSRAETSPMGISVCRSD
jgi:hypothetical protein